MSDARRSKIFYHLLANNLAASVVNFTVWFSLTFFTYLQTKSVFATAVISGIFLVMTAVSGFWFGSIVDHRRKRDAMMLSSGVSLVMFGISFLVYLSAGSDAFRDPRSPALWIFSVLILTGVVSGNIRGVAMPTVITLLFSPKERDRANGLSGTASGISFLVTSVISGILVGMAGMYFVLLGAVIFTVTVMVHLATVHIPETHIVHVPGAPHGKVDIRGTLKVVRTIPGLLPLILFTTINNFLGGVFMALMDAYGLSLVSVQTWGILWGFLSTGFILGGLMISRFGLGGRPLAAMFLANAVIWIVSMTFTIQPWIALTVGGMFIYISVVPYIEAAEHTVLQAVVPGERQGRVFGFAQSVEQMASPLTAFMIGPIAQYAAIPFMTDGEGARLIGPWFGTGPDRGIALVFTLTGAVGLLLTLAARNSRHYALLSERYLEHAGRAE